MQSYEEEGEPVADTLIVPINNRHPSNPDLEPRVRCSHCRKFKVISEFAFKADAEQRHYTQSECRKCRSERQRVRRAEIKAGIRVPKPNAKQAQAQERRAQVGPLIEQGLTYPEIAQQLGCHVSTVQQDARVLGLRRYSPERIRTAVKTNVAVASNAVEQMASMASLVHDGIRPVLDLEGLTIDPDTAAEWERQLVRIGKAVRYLRTTMKGNPT